MLRSSIQFAIQESSQVGDARRKASVLAEDMGFDEEGRGRVSIIVTEIANNILKHAKTGTLLLCPSRGRLEILALDKGPGMQSISECLRDGYSTAGTPGTGLGAIKRLSDDFDLFSAPGKGTVLFAALCAQKPVMAGRPSATMAAVCLPYPGEELPGDAWAASEGESRSTTFLVADGLGHGPLAAKAADETVRIFGEKPESSLTQMLQRMHAGIRSTRGAAASLARLKPEQETLLFSGIGNVAGWILSPSAQRRLVSFNGTLGHQVSKYQEFTYPFSRSSILILHTDGMSANWNASDYPGLPIRHPAVIAGLLFRDFCRGTDDVTIVVAKVIEGAAK